MKPIARCSLIVIALASSCSLARPAAGADADKNVYLFDPLWVDIFDNWKPIGRTTFRMMRRHAFEPAPILSATMEISKAGQMVHGLQRAGLNLPLPEAVRFRAWMEADYLWVVLGDKAGRRVSSKVSLPGMRPRHWCRIVVPLAETRPMGVGAEPIKDFDMIALLMRESAGEHRSAGPSQCYFSRFEVAYPKDIGPQNPTFTKSDLEVLLKPLGPEIEQIDRLLAGAKAKGIDTRYPLVSRTVLERYRREVFSMLHKDDPLVAKRTADFLLACAKRTRRELKTILDHPDRVMGIPDVSLANLRCREGSFFSADVPVITAGVCGWFNPGYFTQLSPMGYTALSIEIGPRSTLPSESETKPDAVAGIKAVMDAAAKHNMVCDLLVSPHYFPGWARKKWPGTDATGWRQSTNGFMPWTITDPHVRDVIARHLAVLIPQVREHPALMSYDLINEAWYRLIPDFPASQWDAFRKNHSDLSEWQALTRMGTENVTTFLQWYVGQLHKHDNTHPIHIKAIDTPDVLSIDREAIGDVLTANGMDAMPSWPDWTGRLAANFIWPLLRHDFHRSCQPDKPIMDGEYHISGGVYPMPDRYVPAALWVLALHGRDMSACWVYDRVDDVSIYWHANGVEGLGRTALDLLRLGREVHAFQRQRGPLAVYYGGTGLEDAYQACLFQDVDVGVLTDRRIKQGKLADYKLLVLPHAAAMPADVKQRVQAFQQAGGLLVQCPPDVPVQQLCRRLRKAVERAKLSRAVRANQWGIECRSLTLGPRKLFYLLNHRRKLAKVKLESDWTLSDVVDLRTRQKLDASNLRLRSLDFYLIEAR